METTITKKLKKETTNKVSIFKETLRLIITPENYTALIRIGLNRVVDWKHVKRMAESVVRNGLTRDVIVMWDKILKKYIIIDGQHLYEALMQLNHNVECRVVEPTDFTRFMIDLNNTSKPFSLKVYIESWAKSGKKDYQTILDKAKETKIQHSVLLMAYSLRQRGESTEMAKNGTFEIVDRQYSETLIGYIKDCLTFLPNTRAFNESLFKVIKSEKYNHTKMIVNLDKYVPKTKFGTGEKQIFEELMKIYKK